ncbi:LysM peptidoglycan-binding domain-containing protein [Cerasicoccus arenae]|uniref:LysM domain-containing protein n=1 Tax=Cerasicoccus arenae TaxID=424488 RepID=A0A8J3DG15_9BACT|nr:LysM domain-containing protein [Cerasicoccus arenae]MBK1857536.1 LysM peptidoglycan-binding domain-containing protein [Cerasicoccus arenae]GHB95582.1 hypothetical protein GCM10007047_09250 [Cerasicoccus arenae]
MYRIFFLFLGLIWPIFACAQNSSFARMNQDMLILSEQVGQLRLQVEELQRQQVQMMKNYEQLLKQQSALSLSVNSFVAETETKLSALPEREAALKREIGAEVSKQIEKLATETQKAINLLAQAKNSTPSVSPQMNFSEDYPSTGFSHVVKSGETISGIARQYGSTTRDIMNANRIASATSLKAGETIFVPVKQE